MPWNAFKKIKFNAHRNVYHTSIAEKTVYMQHRLLIYTIYIHIKFKLYCPALTEGLSLVVVFSAFSVYFSLHSSLFSCPSCGQALERQKEYFDCIRNERDELRDELADLKGKSRMGEVCVLLHRMKAWHQHCISTINRSFQWSVFGSLPTFVFSAFHWPWKHCKLWVWLYNSFNQFELNCVSVSWIFFMSLSLKLCVSRREVYVASVH